MMEKTSKLQCIEQLAPANTKLGLKTSTEVTPMSLDFVVFPHEPSITNANL